MANSLIEEKIRYILDIFAPIKTVQKRTTYQNCISDDTKKEMLARDTARAVAKETKLEADWQLFRTRRNNCTNMQRSDKRNYLKGLYSSIEDENDTEKLFSTTRRLLGWDQPGGPSCLKINGLTYRKQKEVADCQMDFYISKIVKVKSSLPQVNIDPLCLLKRLFSHWIPNGRMPEFKLTSVTLALISLTHS